MNAKVVSEARENFMVYCVKGCREIQKQENQNLVIIEGSEKIIEYVKSILCCAWTGKQTNGCWADCVLTVCVRQVVQLENKFFQKFWQKG